MEIQGDQPHGFDRQQVDWQGCISRNIDGVSHGCLRVGVLELDLDLDMVWGNIKPRSNKHSHLGKPIQGMDNIMMQMNGSAPTSIPS
jgi:hypothetical protein